MRSTRHRDPKPPYRTWAGFDPYADNVGCTIRVARRPSSLVAPPRAFKLAKPKAENAHKTTERAAAAADTTTLLRFAHEKSAPEPPEGPPALPPPPPPQAAAPSSSSSGGGPPDPGAPSTSNEAAASVRPRDGVAEGGRRGGGAATGSYNKVILGVQNSIVDPGERRHTSKQASGVPLLPKSTQAEAADTIAAPTYWQPLVYDLGTGSNPRGSDLAYASVAAATEPATDASGQAQAMSELLPADATQAGACAAAAAVPGCAASAGSRAEAAAAAPSLLQLEELDTLLQEHQQQLRRRVDELRLEKQRQHEEWYDGIQQILPTPQRRGGRAPSRASTETAAARSPRLQGRHPHQHPPPRPKPTPPSRGLSPEHAAIPLGASSGPSRSAGPTPPHSPASHHADGPTTSANLIGSLPPFPAGSLAQPLSPPRSRTPPHPPGRSRAAERAMSLPKPAGVSYLPLPHDDAGAARTDADALGVIPSSQRSSLDSLAELEQLLEEQHQQLISRGFIPAEHSWRPADLKASGGS